MSDIDNERFGRDIFVPIDPDGAIRVSPTGDLQTVEGYANLRAAVESCGITTPGELIHRPEYGGGLVVAVETANTPTGQSRLANQLRRALLRDSRFGTDSKLAVSAKPGLPNDPTRREAVTVTVTATPRGDQSSMTVTMGVAE